VEHIGIDLGTRHSHVVALSASGRVRLRQRVETRELASWLAKRRASRVVMEACTQSPVIASCALEAGHHTTVVPGQFVRLLGVGARGIKTDDRDAEALARASLHNPQLPSVHLRSELSRQRRELQAARAVLLDSRKQIALSIKGWLRGRLTPVYKRASSAHFCQLVRQAAVEHPDGLPRTIELLLQSYQHLCEQIETLQQEVEQLAAQDPVCQLLMTMPGVGPQVSMAFTAHLDDPARFSSADHVASYLALSPGEQTTGGKIRRTGTLRAGPLHLKALLVQSAWSMWRSRPNDPMVLWARGLSDKRGRRIAITALARKIATVLWAMWKHGCAYDPARASSVRATPTP